MFYPGCALIRHFCFVALVWMNLINHDLHLRMFV